MLFYNTTQPQLEEAARLANVRLQVGNPSGRGIRATLALVPSGDRSPAQWQRVSNKRRVNAVCWHGHATFMLHLYLLNRAVRIVGGREHGVMYYDAASFLATFRSTGLWNIGSEAQPLLYSQACACPPADVQEITRLERRLQAP